VLLRKRWRESDVRRAVNGDFFEELPARLTASRPKEEIARALRIRAGQSWRSSRSGNWQWSSNNSYSIMGCFV